MKKIKHFFKKLTKYQIVLLIIAITILISAISFVSGYVAREIQKMQIAGRDLLEYKTVKNTDNENVFKVLVQINNVNGLETVKYIANEGIDGSEQKEVTINCNNKVTISIDMEYTDLHDYTFKIKKTGEAEQTEILHYECPKSKANYIFDDGIYVNEPDLEGFDVDFTRRLVLADNGYMVPDTWILDEENQNWFDYKDNKWANICVENLGVMNYYVWIPRYCYKQNDDQTTDVKFIDVNNNYNSEDEGQLTWNELKSLGYKIPEAFSFAREDNVTMRLAGIWSMKYITGDISTTPTIDYGLIAKRDKLTIKNLKINKSAIEQNPIVKYQIALEGNVIKEFSSDSVAEDGSVNDIVLTFSEEIYEYESLINITGINANGEIVASTTKLFEPSFENEPDLTGFNPSTTFYVTYDENGNENSTIPITESEPENWYDYGAREWANIVTRNNGAEIYYVWIPRYEFRSDSVNQSIIPPNQITDVIFISVDQTEADAGYAIPEAFWWDKNGDNNRTADEELSGFWSMKYIVGD